MRDEQTPNSHSLLSSPTNFKVQEIWKGKPTTIWKGTEAVAVMEIIAVAEKDAELRKSAFKPNSPACKAVVDQVVKIIEKADSKLLVPLGLYLILKYISVPSGLVQLLCLYGYSLFVFISTLGRLDRNPEVTRFAVERDSFD
ncbi:uncharacterized protein LOC109793770 isoform X4 [Cajanus cajan]|uniref:uncharacterized protein LOC109793770 isoform X3 n=1 Tax=Cajanus cajan TaxID=3821 RepID=UPI00098DC74A|nr:uncharacterized protein LOC109793770 isoform X3 [Cajanus cajan]XP_020208832.1 uncharacterized protein LOC109793770 isoform X4 [Cajanus cajan]